MRVRRHPTTTVGVSVDDHERSMQPPQGWDAPGLTNPARPDGGSGWVSPQSPSHPPARNENNMSVSPYGQPTEATGWNQPAAPSPHSAAGWQNQGFDKSEAKKFFGSTAGERVPQGKHMERCQPTTPNTATAPRPGSGNRQQFSDCVSPMEQRGGVMYNADNASGVGHGGTSQRYTALREDVNQSAASASAAAAAADPPTAMGLTISASQQNEKITPEKGTPGGFKAKLVVKKHKPTLPGDQKIRIDSLQQLVLGKLNHAVAVSIAQERHGGGGGGGGGGWGGGYGDSIDDIRKDVAAEITKVFEEATTTQNDRIFELDGLLIEANKKVVLLEAVIAGREVDIGRLEAKMSDLESCAGLDTPPRVVAHRGVQAQTVATTATVMSSRATSVVNVFDAENEIPVDADEDTDNDEEGKPAAAVGDAGAWVPTTSSGESHGLMLLRGEDSGEELAALSRSAMISHLKVLIACHQRVEDMQAQLGVATMAAEAAESRMEDLEKDMQTRLEQVSRRNAVHDAVAIPGGEYGVDECGARVGGGVGGAGRGATIPLASNILRGNPGGLEEEGATRGGDGGADETVTVPTDDVLSDLQRDRWANTKATGIEPQTSRMQRGTRQTDAGMERVREKASRSSKPRRTSSRRHGREDDWTASSRRHDGGKF